MHVTLAIKRQVDEEEEDVDTEWPTNAAVLVGANVVVWDIEE